MKLEVSLKYTAHVDETCHPCIQHYERKKCHYIKQHYVVMNYTKMPLNAITNIKYFFNLNAYKQVNTCRCTAT